jgi:hypothetical protein
MFECYNLLDSMEWEPANFLGCFTTRELQDPMIISLILQIFIFKLNDFSNYVKMCHTLLYAIHVECTATGT